MTDSRGFCPGKGQNWVSDLISRNPQYDIDGLTWDLGDQGRIVTLFGHLQSVKERKKRYDLIILQAGNHEYVKPWSMRMMDYKMGIHDPNWKENLTQVAAGQFRYRNDDLVRKHIIEFKKFQVLIYNF